MLVGWQNFAVRTREDRTWYVELSGLYRREGSLLVYHTSVSESPEIAIEAAWKWATETEGDDYLVVDELGDHHRAVKWNGFMWQRVSERS